MAKKYRYFMSGMFEPTDGEMYEINIPSPHVYDSETEALPKVTQSAPHDLLDQTGGECVGDRYRIRKGIFFSDRQNLKKQELTFCFY